eukprot:CAMPEP_0174851880 /NCGR_PEP_ID=MMETSP1114-20130205/24327_1 /TAXON_ID=312471 /ORGANISM="Neobodo designis, Strain CCAP 1951/1" /LENGTH=421 /DNA_ID=CAMNT_0016086447 /DNA_START=32 /DNA_END=1294 /DNA_ORIENTATION=+
MSQTFGSGLKPVEIPHPDNHSTASAGTTPTFSPANKPTPLIGSWADIGWDRAGEPTSATQAHPKAEPAAESRTGATPLLPSGVSAFEEREKASRTEGTDEYLNNLLTETAKIADGDDEDESAPPKRASTPPPKDADKTEANAPPGGSTTYSRSTAGTGRGGQARNEPPRKPPAAGGPGPWQQPPGSHGGPWDHPQSYPTSYGGPPSGYGGAHQGVFHGAGHHHGPPPTHHHQHHHHHHGNHGHHGHHQQNSYGPGVGGGYGGGYGGGPNSYNHAPNNTGYNRPAGSPTSDGVPAVSKFTPPPPPNVNLAGELGAADSDTPASKVGDVLFALGRRWVQKLEQWLAAHPKERPNAPCPAAEQYATIETWLEKLCAWYEANFNGRRVAGRGRGRGRGGGGGRGGRGPAHIPPPADDRPSFGSAW